ncbi:MAG: ACT domain-containing protein, partial [bacterium]
MSKMLYIEAKVLEDKPGILAKIAQILADNQANISALTTGIEGIIPTEVKPKTIRLLVHLSENNDEKIEKLTQELKKIKEINEYSIESTTRTIKIQNNNLIIKLKKDRYVKTKLPKDFNYKIVSIGLKMYANDIYVIITYKVQEEDKVTQDNYKA